MVILFCFVACLGFDKNYLNASFFIHSNAFAMVYYGLAIIGLYICYIQRKNVDIFWFFYVGYRCVDAC